MPDLGVPRPGSPPRRARRTDLGDFQTPPALVEAVLDVVWPRKVWGRVLEPTCGRGNFVAALCARAPATTEVRGLELQPDYVAETRRRLADAGRQAVVDQANIFEVDASALPWRNHGPLLVVGNPPWVTSAALGTASSSNVPAKSNFKGLTGLAARTGAANFDVAEFILLKLITDLRRDGATVALLCKSLVARNVLEYAAKAALPVTGAAVRKIDAKRAFGASVDACLFTFEVTAAPGAPGRQPRGGDGDDGQYGATVFRSLTSAEPEAVLRVVNGTVVATAGTAGGARVGANEEWPEIDGVSPLVWRQGVKHDAAAAVELTRDACGAWRNAAGELVDVEPDFVFPLAKSTAVFHGRPADARAAIVTQRVLGEDTGTLARRAPKLWAYLTAHAQVFARRKSSIYVGRPAYAMFGVGDYTFAPYKVVVSGLHREPAFRLYGPRDGVPTVCDDACYFLPFTDAGEAAVVCAALRGSRVADLLQALTFHGGKRPITKRVLQRIDLRALLGTAADAQLGAEIRAMAPGHAGERLAQNAGDVRNALIRRWSLAASNADHPHPLGGL